MRSEMAPRLQPSAAAQPPRPPPTACMLDRVLRSHPLPPPAHPSLPAPRPAQAFFFDVVSKAEALACKHQLAVRLAEALGKARTSTLGDLALADLLQA